VLQVKGYQTIESETAEEGLKLVEERSPALILMDINFWDGRHHCDEATQGRPKTQAISIIAITASAMTNNRTSDVGEGFDGYQDQADRVERLSRRSGTSSESEEPGVRRPEEIFSQRRKDAKVGENEIRELFTLRLAPWARDYPIPEPLP